MSASINFPYAFVAKMVAKPGQEAALADFLAGALPLANDEPGTVAVAPEILPADVLASKVP